MKKQSFLILIFLVLLCLAPLCLGAAESDQIFKIPNVFDPHSVPALAIKELSFLVLAICTLIFLAVTAVLIFVVLKYRQRSSADTQEPPQIYGSSQIELAWTVIPILITIVLILATARTIGDIQDKKLPEDALVIKIVGHQWWWEVRYLQYGFVTANEIHVPVSSPLYRLPTRIILESADVLHSFWVPQLAGKMQLVPNKTNITWIEPLKLGIYLGNCAQYCGTQHAYMLLRVVVHTPEEFQQWVAKQKKPAESLVADASAEAGFPTAGGVPLEVASAGTFESTINAAQVRGSPSPALAGEQASGPPSEALSGLAAEGKKTFAAVACVNCHRIDGTSAQGVFGPDLTHFMSRQTIGAGVAANTHENLWQWVRNPQSLKVGCLMPDMQLTNRQVDEIVAYLKTLR